LCEGIAGGATLNDRQIFARRNEVEKSGDIKDEETKRPRLKSSREGEEIPRSKTEPTAQAAAFA
jgi:hypothetical protein